MPHPAPQILEKTGNLSSSGKKDEVPAGDAGLLLAAKERIGRSGWMLREGVGELLLYLASRSVRLGVIASPRTTNTEFNNFMEQLRAQSISVRAAISPDAVSDIGVEAGVARACADLDVGRNSAIMVVGSSDAILRAAYDAEMFTTRFYPPNSVREGVIQSFVVRDVDEVRQGVPRDRKTFSSIASTARLN